MHCENREQLKQRLSLAVRQLITARTASAAERKQTGMLTQAQSVLRRVRGDYARHVESHGCGES